MCYLGAWHGAAHRTDMCTPYAIWTLPAGEVGPWVDHSHQLHSAEKNLIGIILVVFV